MSSNPTVRLLGDIKELLEKTAPQVDEAGDKVDKFGNKVNALGVAITRANKRTSIFRATLKDLSERAKPQKFELFDPRALASYYKQGGSVLEYFAEFLTNSTEDVRILGFEASKFRRFFFGFLPGSFTLLSKIAFMLQFTGGTLRTIFPRAKKGIKETDKEATQLSKTLEKTGSILTARKGELGTIMRTSKLGKFLGLDTYTMTDIQGRKRRFSRGLDPQDTKKGTRLKTLTPFEKKRQEFFESTKKIKFSKLMKQLAANIFMITKRLTFFFLGFLAFVTGLYIILKLLGPSIMEAFETTKKVFLFGLSMLLPAVMNIWTGLKGLWNVVFGNGSLTDFINSLITLGWGVLQLGIGLLITVGGALLTFLASTAFALLKNVGKKILEIGETGKMAATFALVAIFIAWWFTAPVWLTALIGFVVFKAIKILKEEGLKGLKNAVFKVNVIKNSVEKAKGFFEKVGDAFSKGANRVNKQLGGGVELGSDINIAGSYASGGVVRKTGMQLVGENGAELVRLNAGARVYNNRQTREMMGSTVNNFNITINAKDTSKAEMRRVADEIGKMVSTKINRRSSFRNSI